MGVKESGVDSLHLFRAGSNEQLNLKNITNALAARQYADVATRLNVLLDKAVQEQDMAAARMLAATRQLCLSCLDYQSDVAAQRQVLEKTTQREVDLNQQLQVILGSFDSESLFDNKEATPMLAQKAKVEETAVSPTPNTPTAQSNNTSTVAIYCLGPFQLYLNDHLVDPWPHSKSKAVFKYLAIHRKHPIPREVLMEQFWADANPDAARNNLNVAIYNIRQVLRKVDPDSKHILFEEGAYLLNPMLNVWIDSEQFWEHIQQAKKQDQANKQERVIQAYHAAETLYQGEFMADDRYEDWPVHQRQQITDTYLEIQAKLSRHYFHKEAYSACINACRQMLAVEPCREDAHQYLIRCYQQQGQRYLALRQYHLCVKALEEELAVEPSSVTEELYAQIR